MATAADPQHTRLLDRLPRPPRKVALVRAGRVGDFVCATPAFRALRARLPEAEITLVALPFARDLVARSPRLDRFAAFPGFPGIAEQWFAPGAVRRFLARMQAERFDLAVQMHGSGVYANPFTLMLGAAATAGFVRDGDDPGPLDAALPFPAGRREVDRLLALMAFLGAPPRGDDPEFPLWPADERAAARLLAGAEPPLLGLHPGGTDAVKRWPPAHFAAAGAALRRRWGGTLVVLGGAREQARAAAVVRGAGPPALDLAGRTPLPVLGAVIARLAVLVAGDSGPAHLAYAAATPSVTIFGGTAPAEWAPPGRPIHAVVAHAVPCRPCAGPACPFGYPCLETVTVEEVVEAAGRVTGWAPAGARPTSPAPPARPRG